MSAPYITWADPEIFGKRVGSTEIDDTFFVLEGVRTSILKENFGQL